VFLRYEPVLKINPYQRNPEKCMDFCKGNWGSILMLDPDGENFPLKFLPQCSLIRNVQFYPRNPGLNLDPGSTNSSRIAPQIWKRKVALAPKSSDHFLCCKILCLKRLNLLRDYLKKFNMMANLSLDFSDNYTNFFCENVPLKRSYSPILHCRIYSIITSRKIRHFFV
jgi:hypothetical protein